MALEPAAVLIGLREGLEALLIVGVLLGLLGRLGHAESRRHVWWGAALGVAASVAIGLVVRAAFATWFEDQGAAWFEIVAALAAVAILTYMVLWMYQHTRTLLGTVRGRVEAASAEGRWVLVGSLAFVTVLREGVETVLFFSALAARVSWASLMVSGAVGLAASALIAFVIFRYTVRVDLKRFFAVTGMLLVLVAGGLLVHVGHAGADVGLWAHGEPLWDTSATLPDSGHWLGGPLHALVGYEDQPTTLQLLLYSSYVLGVGGWYLAGLVGRPRRATARRATAAALTVVLFAFALAGAAGVPSTADERLASHDHDAGGNEVVELAARENLERTGLRVGVLVRDHGELVHYNASTYGSVKAFVEAVWPYTGLPRELLRVDQGTLFLDEAHPFDHGVHADAELVDAWLSPWSLPAAPVTDPLGASSIAGYELGGAYYLAPGAGPGVGEGDLFELFGLGVYRDWLKMDNHSPRHAEGLVGWGLLGDRLAAAFDQRVVVAFAHGIDPKVDPRERLYAAAGRLAAAGVDVVLDAYQSSIHSDAMNTCMMSPHAKHALRAAGYTGRIVPVGQAGLEGAWAEATAQFVTALVEAQPPHARVSVHLAQHGARPGSPDPCGVGEDQYHANARAQYVLARDAVLDRSGSRGNVTVRQVYGQGADAADDGVLSPLEALDEDAKGSVDHAIVVPYEFWGNAVDNLVYLREALGMIPHEAPYYDGAYETRFTRNGIDVIVTSAFFGNELKVEAQFAAIARTIVELT